MQRSLLLKSLLAGLLALSFGGSIAFADVVFTPGNHPQPGEQLISLSSGTGTTVSGTTTTTGTAVDFSSSQTLTATSVQITTTGLLTNIIVTSPGNVFEDFIADLINSSGSQGNYTLTATANDGIFASTILPLGVGLNFITITVTGGETISSIAFNSSGFSSFQPLAISGLSTVPTVPLPGALPLFATGLGALGLLGWRRKRKVQAA